MTGVQTCALPISALIKNNKFYIQSGAGIVADSIPEKEYTETVNKARSEERRVGKECRSRWSPYH